MRQGLDLETQARYESGVYDPHYRLKVEDANGTPVDLQGRFKGLNLKLPDSREPIGSLTVPFVRELTAGKASSLAPAIVDSDFNTVTINAGTVNEEDVYNPLLQLGRVVTLEVALTDPYVARPADASTLWYEIFRGIISSVEWGGVDSHTASITVDGLGSVLQTAKSEAAYTYDAGTPLETVAQQILNANGFGSVPIYFPSATGKVLPNDYAPGLQKTVWSQLWSLAQSMGWIMYYRYRGQGAPELTFFAPARGKSVADMTVDALDYKKLSVDETEVRNVGYMVFYNEAGTQQMIGGPPTFEDSESVEKYGGSLNIRRPFWINLTKDSPVRSLAAAEAMLTDALSDVADPDVMGRAITRPLVFAEVGVDLYEFPVKRNQFDRTQTWAPFGVTIDAAPNTEPVSLVDVRGKPSAGIRTWRNLAAQRREIATGLSASVIFDSQNRAVLAVNAPPDTNKVYATLAEGTAPADPSVDVNDVVIDFVAGERSATVPAPTIVQGEVAYLKVRADDGPIILVIAKNIVGGAIVASFSLDGSGVISVAIADYPAGTSGIYITAKEGSAPPNPTTTAYDLYLDPAVSLSGSTGVAVAPGNVGHIKIGAHNGTIFTDIVSFVVGNQAATGNNIIPGSPKWVPATQRRLELHLAIDYGTETRSIRAQYGTPDINGVYPVDYLFDIAAGGGWLVHVVQDGATNIAFWSATDPSPNIRLTPYTAIGGGGTAGNTKVVTPETPAETGSVGVRVKTAASTSPIQGEQLVLDDDDASGLAFAVSYDGAGNPFVSLSGDASVGQGGLGALAAPTQGAIIHGGTLGEYAHLAPGTAGHALLMGASIPEWGQYSYSNLSGIPSSFTPSAHAASHGGGGSDPLALGGLSDVIITTVADDELLAKTINGWENQTFSELGLVTTIDLSSYVQNTRKVLGGTHIDNSGTGALSADVTLSLNYTSLKTTLDADFLAIGGTAVDSGKLGGVAASSYAQLSGATFTGNVTAPRVFTTGLSTTWGTTSGVDTGGVNVTMGTSTLATWLISGTSGGVFRSGIQALDGGGLARWYVGTNYLALSSRGADFNGTAVSLVGHAHSLADITSGLTANGAIVTTSAGTALRSATGESDGQVLTWRATTGWNAEAAPGSDFDNTATGADHFYRGTGTLAGQHGWSTWALPPGGPAAGSVIAGLTATTTEWVDLDTIYARLDGATFTGDIYVRTYANWYNVAGGLDGDYQARSYYNYATRDLRFYPASNTGSAESTGFALEVYYNGAYGEVWHSRNDGSGSGLDADRLHNYLPSYNNTGDTVAVRNSSGDIKARLFRPEYTGTTSTTPYIMVQHAVGTGDNYIRPALIGTIKKNMSLDNVENTALSTWSGSSNITTIGTLISGSVGAARITAGTFGSGNYVFNGNIGLGTTDIKAWGGLEYATLDWGGSAIWSAEHAAHYVQDAWYSSGWKYRKNNRSASYYRQYQGKHDFWVAPDSGATGADTAVTWTVALTINNDGSTNIGGALTTSGVATFSSTVKANGILWANGGNPIYARRGVSGGYGDTSGTGTDWGANVWSIGDDWSGTGYGSGYTLSAGQYGLVWLRGSHVSADAYSDEGLYLYHGTNNPYAVFGYTGAIFKTKVKITGVLTLGNDLAISEGGTGTSTLADGGVVVSAGTALTTRSGTANGQVLTWNGTSGSWEALAAPGSNFDDSPPAARRFYHATGTANGAHGWSNWGLTADTPTAGLALVATSTTEAGWANLGLTYAELSGATFTGNVSLANATNPKLTIRDTDLRGGAWLELFRGSEGKDQAGINFGDGTTTNFFIGHVYKGGGLTPDLHISRSGTWVDGGGITQDVPFVTFTPTGNVSLTGDFSVAAGKRIYLDGGTNDYVLLNGTNIDIVRAGTTMLSVRSDGVHVRGDLHIDLP